MRPVPNTGPRGRSHTGPRLAAALRGTSRRGRAAGKDQVAEVFLSCSKYAFPRGGLFGAGAPNRLSKGSTVAGSLEAALAERAERRQLTIMFCDLVDSVGLSTRLDPEDLRDLIATYHRACARSIGLYYGYVARYLGDGVLIYFGYPKAHEDDAERGVRAALDLVQTVAELDGDLGSFPNVDLRVRIGVATGLVVVGDEQSGAIAGDGRGYGRSRQPSGAIAGLGRTERHRHLGGNSSSGRRGLQLSRPRAT